MSGDVSPEEARKRLEEMRLELLRRSVPVRHSDDGDEDEDLSVLEAAVRLGYLKAQVQVIRRDY